MSRTCGEIYSVGILYPDIIMRPVPEKVRGALSVGIWGNETFHVTWRH